jgi:hypothetical protein
MIHIQVHHMILVIMAVIVVVMTMIVIMNDQLAEEQSRQIREDEGLNKGHQHFKHVNRHGSQQREDGQGVSSRRV